MTLLVIRIDTDNKSTVTGLSFSGLFLLVEIESHEHGLFLCVLSPENKRNHCHSETWIFNLRIDLTFNS